MGKRGPQRTPTSELAKRGSWLAKTDERKNEVQIATVKEVPAPPIWLSQRAADLWPVIVDDMHAAGLLTKVDVSACGLICEELANFIELRDAVAREPRRVETATSIRTNPTYILWNESKRDLLRMLRECGLSPASRAGLVLNQPEGPKGEVISLFAKG